MSNDAPEDLTPRVDTAEDDAADPAAPPSEEGADPGLPRELSLAELFPAEVALGAASPDTLQNGAIADVQGGVGSDSGPTSGTPLVAGIVVTLAILLGGGGLLRWRNRDTAYWPA